MAIEARPLTMEVRMKARAIIRTVTMEWVHRQAANLELNTEDVFELLSDYAELSARIVCNSADLPVELGAATDDLPTLDKKFQAYREALAKDLKPLTDAIAAVDAPNDPALVPDAHPDDPEASSDA